MFWLYVSVWCFDGFFVWVVSLPAAKYRPIFITPVLSKVFERLVAVRLR